MLLCYMLVRGTFQVFLERAMNSACIGLLMSGLWWICFVDSLTVWRHSWVTCSTSLTPNWKLNWKK